MKKLLKEISKKVLLLNEFDFTAEQSKTGWLGTKPASSSALAKAEIKLNQQLPQDYKDFLKITNGFHRLTRIGATFLPIDKIDYLINIDEDLVEIWQYNEQLQHIGNALARSILIAGLNEEQYFLLIPPKTKKGKYRYWKFASWMAGEFEYKNLEHYFKSELNFLKKESKGLQSPVPKIIIDFSLRDHVFNGQWDCVFDTSLQFLMEDKRYSYFDNENDLLKLLLLSAGKADRFKEFKLLLKNLNSYDKFGIRNLLPLYEEAAKNKSFFVDGLQSYQYSAKEPSITLDEIETQIINVRPDLLKPKNLKSKIDYQLYFLFEYGNPENFLRHYETNTELARMNAHFMASLVYVSIDLINKAKGSIKMYYEDNFNYRPFEPFLNKSLLGIMDEGFSREMLQVNLQKMEAGNKHSFTGSK